VATGGAKDKAGGQGGPIGHRHSHVCARAHTVVDSGAESRYLDNMGYLLRACSRRRLGRRIGPAQTRRLADRRRSPALRPPLRLRLRSSLRSSLRGPLGPKARNRPPQGGFPLPESADISVQPPGQDTRRNRVDPIALLTLIFAPLALDALAIASALAPQRFSPACRRQPIALGATAIATALARQRFPAAALPARRPAAQWPPERRPG
jgi:hypothetical protein